MVHSEKKEPNPDLAHDIIERCFYKGLLFFSPVGAWGQTVKIAPPLTISEDAISEGLAVLSEAMDEAVTALKGPIQTMHFDPEAMEVLDSVGRVVEE